MKQFPTIDDTGKSRETLANFGGYNHKFGCEEGEFYDMQNMSTRLYPILAPRVPRGVVKQLINPQGLIDKDALIWVDDGKLYIDGVEKTLTAALSDEGEKTLAKMGAYLIILPDKVWYNTSDGTSGSMEENFSAGTGSNTKAVTVTLTDAMGKAITWHDEAYYASNKAQSGDYLMSTSNGKSVLKQWAASTSIWTTVTTTYVMMTCTGIGENFKAGDGVTIQIDNSVAKWTDGLNIFVNDDGNNKYSTNTVIKDRTNDSITFTGIISANKTFTVASGSQLPVTVTRKVPDLAFVTECNNRLWGCSKDGREIYCCKLGDLNNWYVYAGISTDSWAVTVGSDGEFTGATTYQGYPIFFKEDSMIKVSVSSTGAHQTKETFCRGVQSGCGKSLQILNEVLYYKNATGICCYSGSVPYSIGEAFAEDKYTEAVAGVIGDRYYVSMVDSENNDHMFVFDATKGKWAREDGTGAMWFAKHDDDLYYIDEADNTIKSVDGTLLYDDSVKEGIFDWYAESGTIGYTSPDKQYLSRMTVKLHMEYGSRVSFLVQYDDGEWVNLFTMTGKGTRAFTLPFIPRRCDHFKWKLKGRGDAKILSMTKTRESGSDT